MKKPGAPALPVPGLAALFLLTALASCAPAPVRIAVDPDASPTSWEGLRQALGQAVPPVSFEVVAPGAFPPPDLIWFDGAGADPGYLDHALAANASVEDLALAAGVPRAWFNPWSGRMLPAAWSPWAWWPDPDAPAPDPADRRALAAVRALADGPTLGAGTGPGPATEKNGFAWRRFSGTSSQGLPESARVVAAQAVGFWWNEEGWNQDRVPGFLAAVWSKAVQQAWPREPGWLPVNTTVVVGPPGRRLQELGQTAEAILIQSR